MILISYDISDDKLRTRFAKFLVKFGHRLQYSLFSITNSDRILNNVVLGIEHDFAPQFCETDSVMIFVLTGKEKILKYGYAKHDDEEAIFVG